MITTFTVMKPDGTSEQRSADLSRNPTYVELRDLIEPILAEDHKSHDIEHVTVLHKCKRPDMFVNENGMLLGLPRNEPATAIYRHNWLTQHPGFDPEKLNFIVGTAVLFDRIVWS